MQWFCVGKVSSRELQLSRSKSCQSMCVCACMCVCCLCNLPSSSRAHAPGACVTPSGWRLSGLTASCCLGRKVRIAQNRIIHSIPDSCTRSIRARTIGLCFADLSTQSARVYCTSYLHLKDTCSYTSGCYMCTIWGFV